MIRLLILVSAISLIMMGAAFVPRSHTDRTSVTGEETVQDTSRHHHDEGGVDIDHELGEIREKIAGHEKAPAAEVFKNIQLFKTLEAGRVPMVMGFWSRSLGVTCKHCHVMDQWEKEDRPEKQVARDMAGMVEEINTHLLKNIKNLDSPEPRIGCWTCHRGKVIPEFAPPREKK